MKRARYLTALVLAFAAPAACREIPAPRDGVFSVSSIILPSPGLVVGDTMRDSLGAAAPLRVVAFNRAGDTIRPPPGAAFVLLDTTALLAGDFLVGRTPGTARVRASVSGLQTQVQTVPVTLRPDTLVAADSTRHVRRVNLLSGDSSYASPDLGVIIQHRDGSAVTGVDAVVVRYALERIPGGGGANPWVVFVNGGTAPVRDTTSGGGRAARAVRLRIASTPQLPDSAMVAATAFYAGRSLGTVRFTVVFQTLQ